MTNSSFNQVDEVLFSFSYAHVQQASRCNEKLSQLMAQSIVSEIEAGFDQLNYSGLQLELESLEVNLGKLSEEDISYRLGERIKRALLEALKKELSERIGVDARLKDGSGIRSEDFAFTALRSFFLKGYFPSWVDRTWDLFSLIDELLSAHPGSFGKMIREISRFNAVARKRIAYLDRIYFDRIIKVLIPSDATWILDYRNSYLIIHESDGNLPGSSEDLERALNLFILNFITQDSGPKFNRLSFTNRFLKEIAAHYNLDFKLFLEEINRLVADLPLINPLQQDFKEAITWVGEKNLGTDHLVDSEFEPTQADFVAWLNQAIENLTMEKWVSELELKGILFPELAGRFPSFWKSLNTVGLNNFLRLLSKNDVQLWKSMTDDFIAIKEKRTASGLPVQKPDYFIGLYDFTLEQYDSLNLNLFDRSDWYFVQLLFLFSKPVQGTFSSQELIEIGLANGVSNAPLIWNRVRKKINPSFLAIQPTGDSTFERGKPHGSKEEENASFPKLSVQNQENLILEYLNFGLSEAIFENLNENNLLEMVSNLIRNQNPIVLNWIKKYSANQNNGYKSRLRDLILKIDKKQLLDYSFAFEGSGYLKVLLPILNFTETESTGIKKDFSGKIPNREEGTVLDKLYFKNKERNDYINSDSEQTQLIFEYLSSNSSRIIKDKAIEEEILTGLLALIDTRNPILLKWIREAVQSSNSSFRLRLKELISRLNGARFLKYISAVDGVNALKQLLTSSEFEGLLEANPKFKQISDSIESGLTVGLVQSDDDMDPKDSIHPKSRTFQELALLGYLNSGILGSGFKDLAEKDLVELLLVFVKNKNHLLLEWMKKRQLSNSSPEGQRLWGLVRKLDRKDLLAFISNTAGPQTNRLLELENLVSEHFKFPSATNKKLDHFIWSTFVADITFGKREGDSFYRLSQALKLSGIYLTLLSQDIPSSLENYGKIRGLHRNLDFLKGLLMGFLLNPDFKKYNDELPSYLALKGSFLKAKQSLLIATAPKATGPKLDLTSLVLDIKNWSNKKFDESLIKHFYQLSKELKEKSNLENAKKAALNLLKSDFGKIKRVAIDQGFASNQRSELKAAIYRIFSFIQADSAILYPLFLKHKAQLIFMLPLFKESLGTKDWMIFERWISENFGSEFKKYLIFWESGNDSLILQLKLLAGKSKSDFDLTLKHSLIPNQSSTQADLLDSFKEEIRKLFGTGSPTFNDLVILFDLPHTVFKNKQTAIFWRRLLLLSLAFYKSEKIYSSDVPVSLFWKKFGELVQGSNSKFGFDSMNWDFVLTGAGLNSSTQSIFSRFIYRNYNPVKEELRNTSVQEGLLAALVFLKAEGYLPWWSPIKSKSELIHELLRQIENSKSEEASALISVLISGNSSGLILGLRPEELSKLKAKLLLSKYQSYFQEFYGFINSRISRLDARKLKSAEVNLQKKTSNRIDTKNFKNLTAVQQEKEIKKRLNAGQEAVLIRTWFGIDPRIQKQINDLMAWSPLIYFGSLNSGKWKLWLLTFGFNFYVRRGQSYSRGFLSQFLSYLIKSQSAVNWKGVAHQLIRSKEFQNDQNKFYRVELLNLFPIEEKVSVAEAKTGDQVRVKNAGLVLCWPFLSVLFSRLKLSVGNKIPEENQSKAVYLLQHLVFGHSDFPEYELVLNKIMVGMKSGQHLEKVELSKEEKDMTESLLSGMKSNWEKMKNASLEAIRETFLQREGLLEFGDESFILRVPKTGVDILLDSVSWNIAVIRMPWMEKSLEVKWR